LKRHLTAIAVFAALASIATTAGATEDATGIRIAGADRYETAQMVTTATFETANVAILVSGVNYPDALAATYLAGVTASPILLTDPNTLSDGIIDTLQDLGVNGVLAIGGESALSSDVLNELQAAGYTVDRVAGENRFSTARQVAELPGTAPIGAFGTGRAAIIVNGLSFPDTLAAGPIAAAQGMPILLTTPGALHPDAENALLDLDIEQVLIIGGTGAVTDEVFARIHSLGIDVRRIAGPSRQETAAEVAAVAFGELLFPADRVLLARSDSFADALTGGIRGGTVLAPILLIAAVDDLGPAAGDVVAAHKQTIETVEVLGGTAGVSDDVLDNALLLARS
jgi:lactocepin